MPRKAADKKTTTAPKKTNRKKKDSVEAVAEVITEPVVETAPVAEEVPAKKKRGRKPGTKKAEAIEPIAVEVTAEEQPAVVEETPAEITAPTETVDAAVKKDRKPRAKKAGKKDEPVLSTVVQIGDAEYDITDITAKAYKAFKSVHKRKVVTDFCVYVKPEEGAAYYTVNGEGAPEYKIDL